MILTVKERSLRINPLPIATLPFTNPTWTSLGLNTDHHGGSLMTNRPIHETAFWKVLVSVTSS
jgi:hypothetical protein